MKRSFPSFIIPLILGLTVLAALPAFARDRDTHDERNYEKSLLGTVMEITDSRNCEFTVRTDSYGAYQVTADEADVTYRGRNARFRDLHVGDNVRINGDFGSRRIMNARTVEILDRNDDDRFHSGLGRNGTVTTISGFVKSIDGRRGTITMAWNAGTVEVLTGRHTDVREMGRRREVAAIHSKDFIKVTGTVESPYTITANTIDIGQGKSSNRPSMQTMLMGRVTHNSGRMTRYIKVSSPLGEVSVMVPKGVVLKRGTSGISVHDIRKGETVRISGTWESNTFVANAIDVTSDQYGERYFGRIDDINYRSERFTLRLDRNEYTVKASEADITDGSRTIRFADLKNGQDISVYGELRGSTIYADRIEKGRFFIRKTGDDR